MTPAVQMIYVTSVLVIRTPTPMEVPVMVRPFHANSIILVFTYPMRHTICTYIFFSELHCKQEGKRCPKRWVAQAAIKLATAVIKFKNKERNVRSPS